MRILIAIMLLGLAGCAGGSHRYTVDEVEQSIRSGKVDKKIAEHVAGRSSLAVRDISVAGLPIQLFAFDDDAFTHTLVVDGADLILLGGGPKGEVSHDFRLEREGSLWVLTFKLGSLAEPGRYILKNPPDK